MKAVGLILALVGLAAFAAVDVLFASDGSLLIPLLFWSALVHGTLAITAAADLAKGEWFAPIRPVMVKVWPLLYLFPLAFLIFARDISLYGWLEHPTAWLQPDFFIWRNIAVLLWTAVMGHLYVLSVGRNGPMRGTLAVLYIFAFVTAHSFAAWDWVMPLEFPWISTMLGPLFFVGALYLGICLSAIVSAILRTRHAVGYAPVLKDTATMVFGFALLWAGLFYGQYLTIWYGNIPEEVVFFHKRMTGDGGMSLFAFILLTHFAIPFLGLIPSKARTTPAIVIGASLLVMVGYVAEKVFYIEPAAHVSPLTAVLGLVALGIPVVAVVASAVKSAAAA